MTPSPDPDSRLASSSTIGPPSSPTDSPISLAGESEIMGAFPSCPSVPSVARAMHGVKVNAHRAANNIPRMTKMNLRCMLPLSRQNYMLCIVKKTLPCSYKKHPIVRHSKIQVPLRSLSELLPKTWTSGLLTFSCTSYTA